MVQRSMGSVRLNNQSAGGDKPLAGFMNHVFYEQSARNGQDIFRITEIANGIESSGEWVETVESSIIAMAQRYAEKVGSAYAGKRTKARAA